ncbi:hypothetical protein K227x_47120 [Rubripirellula lacrimiformis]|uniref:Uncharacterized protein n=1 Tax=Rubripirellula lacrimiformis TaxID=1930273 RepID=A0A517NGV9_9BACT|nr:hypothetical protein K227x_47120 [Rubripirellula lacrimiformis]
MVRSHIGMDVRTDLACNGFQTLVKSWQRIGLLVMIRDGCDSLQRIGTFSANGRTRSIGGSSIRPKFAVVQPSIQPVMKPGRIFLFGPWGMPGGAASTMGPTASYSEKSH